MRKIIITLAVAIFAAGSAAASDETDVMATVHQWVEGFNKGDAKSSIAACADETSIIDDLPPHEWHGPGACAKWMNDFDAFAKQNEITAIHFTLGKARHDDVTADHAYVVVPVTFTYSEKGSPVKELSTATLALQKGSSGWRITGWAWSQH